jgi:hypothetical protein
MARKRSPALYRYLVVGHVPEIDAEPNDVFVWRYPNVYLIRRLPGLFEEDHEAVIKLKVLPNYWWFILSKYEDRFAAIDEDAPAPPELAAAIPSAPPPPRRSGGRPPRGSSAPREEESPEPSILDYWPGPEDDFPPPLLRLLP